MREVSGLCFYEGEAKSQLYMERCFVYYQFSGSPVLVAVLIVHVTSGSINLFQFAAEPSITGGRGTQ